MDAITELFRLLTEQLQSVMRGDPEFASLDNRISDANRRKEAAKCALMAHIHEHGCAG